MAVIARNAQHQIERLAEHFLRIDRPEAVQRLKSAIEEACRDIDVPRLRRRSFPGVHSELALLGLEWIKVHAYWFGFKMMPDGEGAVANVVWHRADIPSRVATFDGRL